MSGIAVRDWFPCDLARNDDQGKALYVGVYTDEIQLSRPTFPFQMPLVFAFRLEVKNFADPNRTIRFAISDPEGSVLASAAAELPVDFPKGTRLNVNITLAQIRFPGPGQYRVSLGIGSSFEFDDVFKITASTANTGASSGGPQLASGAV